MTPHPSAMYHEMKWRGKTLSNKKNKRNPYTNSYHETVAKKFPLHSVCDCECIPVPVKMMDDKLNLCLGSEGEL